MMDTKTKASINSKTIFRISISAVVSIIAAKIVFIIFWSLTLFPGISNSSILGGLIFFIGTITGLTAFVISFLKLNNYLKHELQKD